MTELAGKRLSQRPLKLAIYLPDFQGGGVERATLMLIRAFLDRGLNVRVIVHRVSGQLSAELPPQLRVISLDTRRAVTGLFKLAAHLRSEPPDILLSNLGHNNIVALWARAWARLRGPCPTRVIICQHNALSVESEEMGTWRHRLLPWLYRLFGGWAEAIVGVSDGVCDDVSAATGLDRSRLTTLYNPVVDPRFLSALAEASACKVPKDGGSWTVLGMGRLVPQKDFATLLRAFALIEDRNARLVIAGDGPEKESLTKLAQSLGISDRVELVGFVLNPIRLLCNADVFALSSRYEGLGNVLIEALACGLPVVSTRCPFGPAEILENGTVGILVPVGDAIALSDAIGKQRAQPFPGKEKRISRAMEFNIDIVADRYLKLFDSIGAAGAS